MELGQIQEFADAHANAMATGDTERVIDDVAPEALDGLRGIGAAIPTPVDTAEVVSVEVLGTEARVRIRYTGGGRQATVQSLWAHRNGRPRVIDASLVT